MEAARGDLVVWTDDDVLVDPEWLFAYIGAAEQWPETTYFGGPVDPLFSISPPGWVVRHLSVLRSPYALRDYGSTVRPLGAFEEPFGANMAIRRDRIGRLRFDDRLGRKGSEMISGDESDFFQRLRQEGHSGVWVGTAGTTLHSSRSPEPRLREGLFRRPWSNESSTRRPCRRSDPGGSPVVGPPEALRRVIRSLGS